MGSPDQIIDAHIEWKTSRLLDEIRQRWEARCDVGEFDGLSSEEQIDAWTSYNAELICVMEDGCIERALLTFFEDDRRRRWKKAARAKKQRRARCGRR